MTEYNISIIIDKRENPRFFEGNGTLNIIGIVGIFAGFLLMAVSLAIDSRMILIALVSGFAIMLVSMLMIKINGSISDKKLKKRMIHGKAILSNLNNNLICIFTSEYGETIIFNLGNVIANGNLNYSYLQGKFKKVDITNLGTEIEYNGRILNHALGIYSTSEAFNQKLFDLGLIQLDDESYSSIDFDD